LGFALPGLTRDGLARAFARTPLSVLAAEAITRQSHPTHRVSIGHRLASSTHRPKPNAEKATLIGFPHRPGRQTFKQHAIGLMYSPLAGPCITADSTGHP
jgi:hypothetical protein